MNEILFPEIKSFSEMFESATLIKSLDGYESTNVHTFQVDEILRSGRIRKGTGRAHISSFCVVTVPNPRHLDVVPNEKIVEAIRAHMLLCDQYVINFHITVRDDGTALVTAKYNMILGSRWFALIDANTIPNIKS